MRVLAILTCCLALALAACGGDDKGTPSGSTPYGAGTGKAPTGTPTPAAPAPAPAPSGALAAAAGTYVLDMEAMKTVLDAYAEESLKDQKGDDEELYQAIKQGFLEQTMTGLAEVKDLTLKLTSEGTMSGHQTPDGEVMMRGTWALDGTAVTLSMTEEKGKPKDPPVGMKGTLEGGLLKLRFDEAQPFDFVLRRK